MARLSEGGGARFMILDEDQLYDEAEIDRICARHRIEGQQTRMALWRTLEEAGRRLLDRRRLKARRVHLSRLKQELQLGMRLADQLSSHVPSPEQLSGDQPSIGLSRHHLAALREGERLLARDDRSGRAARLEDAAAALSYLSDVYEAALEACTERGVEECEEEAWRARLQSFYTRTLARPWSSEGDNGGERFLADCRAPLRDGEPDSPDASAEDRDAPGPARLAAAEG
ncbi:hypothetical protein DDZ18_12635 [Marinicauda salina]|uniref:Uncharacterized protein n=1 Tax=Marinicauda salina TaxID=2135793 RepID=A0A2U2BRG4_9PROT|nr:hypothetical protein [Marinicauda salina]PWE16607.1 hypothetical protein DDZ18_12635 [Marinicauda salina]